jgi:hypothetical protein
VAVCSHQLQSLHSLPQTASKGPCSSYSDSAASRGQASWIPNLSNFTSFLDSSEDSDL